MIKTLKVAYKLFKKTPILAVWNLTDACNYDCAFCNSHDNNKKPPSLSEIKKTVKNIKEMGIEYVYLQGGEPLLRKDIKEILALLLENSIKPTLITNGSLLNNDIIDFIKNKDINLSISIEAILNKTHYKITGNKNISKTLEFISTLKNIKHKGNWSITSTVTKANINEISKIEKFAEENKFMYVIRSYMYDIGSFGKKDSSLVYNDELNKVKKIFRKFIKKEKKRNYLAYLVYTEELKYLNGKYNKPCDAGKYMIMINSNGSVGICLEKNNISVKNNPYETLKFIKTKNNKKLIKKCYIKTPCFHGCNRNIGILINNKSKIILNIHKLVRDIKKYSSFF